VNERHRLIAAVHVLFLRDDSVLLLRRANTGYEDGNFSVPAGHVERGETVTQAAIREAFEETGGVLEAADVRHALVMHRRAEEERIDFFVTVERWSGEPSNTEPGKCDELRWAPVDALPDNLIPYVRRAIQGFRDGERYVEFGWERRLGRVLNSPDGSDRTRRSDPGADGL
jgi:8-oxo-dGTP diphosphatase